MAVYPTFPFLGQTQAQIEALLTETMQRRNSLQGLVSSSINGDSFTHESSSAELRTLDRRLMEIQAALHYLDPTTYPLDAPAQSTRIDFRECR